MRAQERIRVDGDRMSDKGEHRDVVRGVGVRRAAREVQPLALGDGPHGLRLRETVEGGAHEPTGVDPAADLRHGAECTGEPEVLGDDGGELHRRSGDEPHALPRVEMLLRERERAGDELVRHLLVEDLLAEVDQLVHASTLDEGQRRGGRRCHVLEILRPAQHEPQLATTEVHDLSGVEEASPRKAHREVEDACPAHHRVVDVEERGCRGIDGCSALGDDLGRGRGRLAGMAIGGQHGRASGHSVRLGGWPKSG